MFLARTFTSRNLPALAAAGAWLASVLVVVWLASGWFWELAAPAAADLPTKQISDPVAAAKTVAARHLMGEATNSTGGADTSVPGRFRLTGVMTGNGRIPGFAIVSENGKAPAAVIEGNDIAPGITLSKVLPRQVQITHQGRTETLELPGKPAQYPPLPVVPSVRMQPPRPAGDNVPAPSTPGQSTP